MTVLVDMECPLTKKGVNRYKKYKGHGKVFLSLNYSVFVVFFTDN